MKQVDYIILRPFTDKQNSLQFPVNDLFHLPLLRQIYHNSEVTAIHNKMLLSQLLHLKSVPLTAPLNITVFALLLNYSLGIPRSFQDAKKQLYFSILLDTQSTIHYS